MIYKSLLRPLLFALDPESAHHVSLACLRLAASLPLSAPLFRALFDYRSERLATKVAGLTFASPVGLAAGFDKSGRYFPALSQLGFGSIECGSFTAKAQSGNPRPRLFRFPEEGALLNRMGFNNPGAQAAAYIFSRQPPLAESPLKETPLEKPLLKKSLLEEPLREGLKMGKMEKLKIGSRKKRPGQYRKLRGINIGKSQAASLDEATEVVEDYLVSLRLLAPYADWLTLNVSSPNTPGLRELQTRQRLSELLQAAQAELGGRLPLFVKIAPDLKDRELEQLLELLLERGVAGVIVANTSLDRSSLPKAVKVAGGLSGRPLRTRCNELIARCYRYSGGRLAIVGVGGIDSGEAALEKLALGASLLQLYTGLIFEGPALPSRINRYLDHFLKRENCSLSDLIGSASR